MNGYNLGQELLYKGYDLVMLDFPEGGTYIERNAMVCIEVINSINNRLRLNNSQEEIVVVGPSMGGQITRYALSYMEQHSNINTNYGNHNCRLWISFDSPHQGANISIGAQALIDYFSNENGNGEAAKIWKNTICSIAAQQMLMYHKKSGAGNYFTTYYNSLANLGYPTLLRKVAISNGSLNNTSNGTAYQLAFEGILPCVLYTLDIRIRNVVQVGTGQVFSATHWIGFIPIHITWTFTNNYGKGSPDVAPGCKYGTFDLLAKVFTKKHLVVSTNQHTHCFMPITSVLDLSGNMNYNTNISNRDMVAEGKTPFNAYWGPVNKNMDHISFDANLVNWIFNEIETYIQGNHRMSLCNTENYVLHFPQGADSPTIKWHCSDNLRIVSCDTLSTVQVKAIGSGDAWITVDAGNLTHSKELAHYEIFIPDTSDFPVLDSTTIISSYTITTQTTLNHNITIDSNAILNINSTLFCSPNAHIIVRPGGKLVVDGGTLTSACDGEMWPGIEIMGDRTKHQLSAYQGVVELKNGAVIENAYNALRTGYGENYWSTTGGIIRADSAFFRNNQRSVELLSYADTITSGTIRNNFSYFKKCTFIVDTNNLFGATGCTFYNHISMWDVKGIQITGCHFYNAMSNLVTNRGRAIYTLDAGFSIKTACDITYNIFTNCSCPESWATYNTFEGFSTAINANTSGSQYAITIDETVFNNNLIGISINGNNAATITRNTFNLPSGSASTCTGLVLNSCTGFKVEGNNFYRAAYTANLNYVGIAANNLGTAANNLYLNKFTNLNYGIYITGANGNRTTGLLCSCDTFNHNQFDILLNRSSSILPSQGSYSKGADNSFYLTESSSFQVLGIQRISYYYSIGGQHSPINPSSSITQYGTATANTCASTLCNNLVISNRAGSSYTAMRNQYDSLLNVFEEQDYASVLDNADAVSGVYTTATLSAAQSTQATLLSLGQSLYETSQTAVRQIMQDSILRLADLEDWHTAMPGISARYALAETQYQNGESNALTLHGIPTSFALTTAERDEYDNYLDFNTLKTSLTPVGWPNATDAQIAELQRIAELNTGRASEMAKGVLCFFFDICYDNTVEENTTDEAPRYGNTGHQFETMSDDILVYPNPTTGQIEITTVKSELKIKDISVTDIYGKIIFTQFINDYFGTADLSSLTAGIYLLRATMEDGSVAVRKVMKQ